jgi:hypothetical protein
MFLGSARNNLKKSRRNTDRAELVGGTFYSAHPETVLRDAKNT